MSSADGDQEQGLDLLGQAPAAVEEHALHGLGQPQLWRQRHDAAELVPGERGGQFDECERVAVGLLEQRVRDLGRAAALGALAEQDTRRRVRSRPRLELRDVRRR